MLLESEEKFIDYILNILKESVKVGFEEQPNRFKFTRYVINMMDIFNLTINDLSNTSFDKILYEFTDYIKT